MQITPTEQGIAWLTRVWAEALRLPEIGPDDNFFDLKADSLTATRVVARLRDEFGVELPLRAVFELPTVRELVRHPALSRHTGRLPEPSPDPADEGPVMSGDQERLWFLDQLRPGSPAYLIATVVRFTGMLDVPVLERCLAEIVRRHEVLRTVFTEAGGRPVPRVLDAVAVPVPVVDLRSVPAEIAREQARARAAAEAGIPLALDQGPLLRVQVIHLPGSESWLLLTVHHIVADGRSFEVLVTELNALYDAFARGEPSPLPPLPGTYAGWVRWQRDQLTGDRLADLLSWWRNRLEGVPPVLALPADRPRPAVRSDRGARLELAVPPDLAAALARFAAAESVTMFMVLLAGFTTLLHRYTGQTDVVVGTPVANRARDEIVGVVGFFANTVPLRCDLSGTPSFRQVVRRVRDTTLDAYAHQALPFGRLVQELRPERTLAWNPVVQVLFAFQRGGASGGRFRVDRAAAADGGTAKFDLTLNVYQDEAGLSGSWEYDTDLFEAGRIELMGQHLSLLLRSALREPDRAVDQLSLLTDEQRAALEAKPAEPSAAGAATLTELFATAAARYADRPAVSAVDGTLSYGELNRAANRLSHRLRHLGVGRETLVGVCADRGADYVVALLAVLKAGAGYVPLDPTYPAERLTFTLTDAGCPIVVGQQRFRDRLARTGVRFLAVDADPTLAEAPCDDPPNSVWPDDVAYVIYTSGSTGRPKGVVVTHANAARLFAVTRDTYAFSADDVWSLFHSFAFDFSVWELWGALLHGGRVVIVPYATSRDPEAFVGLLRAERVTVLSQTPSAFGQLSAAAEDLGFPPLALRLVVFGGEMLEPAMLRTWFDHYGDETPRLVNMYGITETTVHVTERVMVRADTTRTDSPIGSPLPDLQVYVLDSALSPVPPGVVGEIHVGGPGVSRGYLGRPDLTAERFRPNPFGNPGDRMYRTGDLAIRRPDGELVFCGRADNQVQLRGFRIELGEIEHEMLEQPSVREAAAAVRPNAFGVPGLVGYVVVAPGAQITDEQLRSGLARRLPQHMVPAIFVRLDRLPLTANGKLDRAALPAPPAGRAPADSGRTPPQTAAEQRLARIFSEMLGGRPVGRHDNFFEVGGHSLLATRMMARVRDAFDQPRPVRLVFESPTVAGLAAVITATQAHRPSATATPWLLGSRRRAGSSVRLLCFPYAGGAGSLYQGWPDGLPDSVDVCPIQLPGRQDRLAERPYERIDALLDALDEALRPLSDQPWALFGHSFGGLLAFEFARLLQRRGRAPGHLFVAALRPPELLAGTPGRPRPDEDLLARVRGTGDVPPDTTDDDLREFVLPAYRADLTVLDGYVFREEAPLTVPLSVFGGDADSHPTPAQLELWQRHTSRRFRSRVLAGGHFFLDDERATIQAAITADLRAVGLLSPT